MKPKRLLKTARLCLAGAALLMATAGISVAQEVVNIEDIVPDTMPGDLELAVIPRPKQEKMADTMIAVRQPVFLAPGWESLRAGTKVLADVLAGGKMPTPTADAKAALAQAGDTLVVISFPEDQAQTGAFGPKPGVLAGEMGKTANAGQAYRLSIRRDEGLKRNVIFIHAVKPAGAYYAAQTLRQLTFAKDGVLYVRIGEIFDWPTFAGRGGKRNADPWFLALKNNFYYTHMPPRQMREENFTLVALAGCLPVRRETEKGPALLDVSPAALARYIENWRTAHDKNGMTDLRLHVDDQPMRMTAETEKLFNGDYFAAMRHLIRALNAAVKETDPNAKLYFLPTTYWTITPYEDYAHSLWPAGEKPPADYGVAPNGPQVSSQIIPPDEVKGFNEAFGATERGVTEDWSGRMDFYAPTPPRSPALARYLVSLGPGTATPTNYASRLDWGWNPEDYDPDRSLMLACREFAGLQNAMKLYEAVRAYEYMPGTPYEPRDVVLKKTEQGLSKAAALAAELRKQPDEGLNGRLKLPRQETGKKQSPLLPMIEHFHMCIKAAIEKKLPVLKAAGYRELDAVPANGLVNIDGMLDDAAWASAPESAPLSLDSKPVAPAAATTFRAVYDADYLYFAFRCNTPKPIDFAAQAEAGGEALGVKLPPPSTKQTGPDMRGIFCPGGWECIALMLDPKHDHLSDYEFHVDAAGRGADGRFDQVSDRSPGGLFWNSGWKRAVRVAKTEWTAELAIPWKNIDVAPKPGMVMGLQAYRTGPGTSSWSTYRHWLGIQSPQQYGHLILK